MSATMDHFALLASKAGAAVDRRLRGAAGMTETEVLEELHLLIEGHGSQKHLAQSLGVSDAYISSVVRGRQPPGPKILEALNLRRVVRYEWVPA